ncbi:MAG: RNA 2',3'-cyclic phosphodiesterase [Candidatus Woesearchaeota archaeon]
MRLFVAIDLPKEVKDYLFELGRKLNKGFAKVRWVPKKNLHMTCKFIGEVEEGRLPEIKERLSKVKIEPIKCRLSKLGWFPGDNEVRVIWVGAEPEEEIIGLQQSVDAELLDLFPSDQKFTAHLTLGRVAFLKKRKEFLGLLKETSIEKLKFTIDKIKLYKSTLKKEGPQYEVLESYPEKSI